MCRTCDHCVLPDGGRGLGQFLDPAPKGFTCVRPKYWSVRIMVTTACFPLSLAEQSAP